VGCVVPPIAELGKKRREEILNHRAAGILGKKRRPKANGRGKEEQSKGAPCCTLKLLAAKEKCRTKMKKEKRFQENDGKRDIGLNIGKRRIASRGAGKRGRPHKCVHGRERRALKDTEKER